MPDVHIHGPWSRRQMFGSTACAVGVLTALKLLIGQEAGSPSTAPRSAVPVARVSLPSPPYTPRLRRVIEVARESAFDKSQPVFEQEDLLLSMAVMPVSGAIEVLRRFGVSQEQLRAEADAAMADSANVALPVGQGFRTMDQVQPAPAALLTLALMEDESRGLAHQYVGVEHLLLGMLRQGDGPAYGALTHLGLSLDPARRALTQWLASR